MGGSGKLYSYNDDYKNSNYTVQYKNLDVDISASLGYFVADKVSFGLRPTFSWTKSKWVSATGGVSGGYSNIKRYSIGPFGRYYFLNINKPFNLVGDISYRKELTTFMAKVVKHAIFQLWLDQ